MPSLLEVNGVKFPDPDGNFDIKYRNNYNEYEGETGEKTLEIIRESIASISVSYKGLLSDQLDTLVACLGTVNTVKFNKNGTPTTSSMKLTEISTPKKYHKNGLSVWGMSFTLEEL